MQSHDRLQATLAERPKTHGDYAEVAELSQALKRVVRGSRNWDRMRDFQRETLEMWMHKIARICAGDPDFPDHWHDVAGYARITEERL